MRKRERDILAMAVSGIAATVFYFSVFRPPAREAARLKRETKALLGSVREFAERIARAPDVGGRIEQCRERLASMKEDLRRCSNPLEIEKLLVNEAVRLRLDVSVFRSPDDEARGGKAVAEEIYFRVRMPCSWRSFAEYAEAIGEKAAMISVEEISLKRADLAAKMLTGELKVGAVLFLE